MEIDQNGDDWIVRIRKLGDRKRCKTEPHSIGFYHYPVTMSNADAFNALYNKMVKDHVDEIERVGVSLKKLINLKTRFYDIIKKPKEKNSRILNNAGSGVHKEKHTPAKQSKDCERRYF